MRVVYLAGQSLQCYKETWLDRLQPDVSPFCAPMSAWGKSTAGKNGAVLRGYAPGRVPAQCYRLSAPAGACGKGSLPEWAVQRFDEMLQVVLQPNVITFMMTPPCSGTRNGLKASVRRAALRRDAAIRALAQCSHLQRPVQRMRKG